MDVKCKFCAQWKPIILAVLMVIVIINCLVGASDQNVSRILGVPIISYDYSVLPYSSIDQIVSDDHYVYILYGEHDGNVQVFTSDGEYQYSAYFYTHLNGTFRIAAQNGKLYVRDERKNVYILKDGELQLFVKADDAAGLLSSVNFAKHSDCYRVRFGSVYRYEGQQQVCIIKRPLYAMLYQNNFLFILSLCVVGGARNCPGKKGIYSKIPKMIYSDTDRYYLELDPKWNTVKIDDHSGRHTKACHDLMLNAVHEVDSVAQGDVDLFLEGFGIIGNFLLENTWIAYATYMG